MVQRLNEKSKEAGADQGSECASTQSAKSRKDESTVLVQNPQPQVINHQQVHFLLGHKCSSKCSVIFQGHRQRMMTPTTSNMYVNP